MGDRGKVEARKQYSMQEENLSWTSSDPQAYGD